MATTLRSATVIGALAAHFNAGHTITITTAEGVYTAGQAPKAVGPRGWEVNFYGQGRSETDDAFWNAHHLARQLVRVMFDKRRVNDALVAAQCRL